MHRHKCIVIFNDFFAVAHKSCYKLQISSSVIIYKLLFVWFSKRETKKEAINNAIIPCNFSIIIINHEFDIYGEKVQFITKMIRICKKHCHNLQSHFASFKKCSDAVKCNKNVPLLKTSNLMHYSCWI
jgi:hypothetical protein